MSTIGRPNKYLKDVQYRLGEVEEMATKGLTNKQIAKNLGISEGRLYEWQNDFPEFREALKRGKDPADYEVENALYRSATGYWVEEETITEFEDGSTKVETKKKYIPPNPTSNIFWLKNRRADKYRDKREHEVTQTTFNVTIEEDDDDDE